MTQPRATLMLLLFVAAFTWQLRAEEPDQIVVDALKPESQVSYDLKNNIASGTNGLMIRYGQGVLTAARATADRTTGEVVADGNVRIQDNDELWIGDHIRYNFKTHQMETQAFRTGKPPLFAAGKGLNADNLMKDATNQVYRATNAVVTTDDFSDPAIVIKAKHIKIIPGKRLEATDATLYMYGVPVFYFPYYFRDLSTLGNEFNFTPGYRSAFGAFLLNTYTWIWNPELDGELHLDYRQRRGVGGGPDINYHFGRWGEGTFHYYYTRDDNPGTNAPPLNAPLLENRQRVYFSYQANPFTNVFAKALVRYQNDIGVVHDFFESEYTKDPQPDTFVELNKIWQNFSLDATAQPRVNNFYETVERLPDVQLTGFRRQIANLPFYYESQSSAGYYERLFAETNGAPPGLNYAAARADTYHQITLPETLFGWLNVTPRVGGRFTYYGDATGPGATTSEVDRGIFNTGAEVSFKASRVWPELQSSLLDMDGLRHILVPSINYMYVPRPNDRPTQLPQFDYELPSLRLLPMEFPEYNAVDSIDSENAIRFGLANKLQTKRNGQVQDFLNWQVYTDWRLRPNTNQQTYADLYSDLSLHPRSWLTLQSQTRFDINNRDFRMALHTLTIEPNDVWSWTIGHFYLRDDFSGSPTALGQGNNLISSALFYRLNENWGLRATHHYDLRDGRMEDQYYTIYRDLRSWTAALTAGLRDNGTGSKDFIVTFTFSLKAHPRAGLGTDTVEPYSLLGR